MRNFETGNILNELVSANYLGAKEKQTKNKNNKKKTPL